MYSARFPIQSTSCLVTACSVGGGAATGGSGGGATDGSSTGGETNPVCTAGSSNEA